MHGGGPADTSHYAVLGVKRSATTAVIRAAYLEQVRRYHPDKVQQLAKSTAPVEVDSNSASDANDVIHRVNQAYVTLSNDSLRQQYDRKLADSATSSNQHPRVSATIDFEAFVPIEKSDSTILFTYTCRCGSFYTLDEAQVHDRIELIGCSGCSEVIQVHYDVSEI